MLNLRYSQLAMLARCPRQFELRYVHNISTPAQSYLALGRGCHWALAVNFQYKIDHDLDMPINDVLQVFSDTWDKGQFGPEDEDSHIPILWDEPKSILKDVGVLLLKSYLTNIAPHITPLAVEQTFTRELCGVRLESRPDLVCSTGLVDYKTAKRNRSQNEVDNDLQPTCHILVSNSPGSHYEFHMLLKQKVPTTAVLTTTRTEAELEWFRTQFLPPIVRMITSGIFPPLGISSWVCHPDTCSYYQVCRR